MSPSPAASPASLLRRRGPLALAAAVLGLAAAAPSAVAAPGVYRGTGADPAGDAPSNLDVLGTDVAYNRGTGYLRVTIRMGAKPPGDVDVLLGARQANGTCGMPFITLSTNAAAGTGEWRGSAGRANAKARVTYANGVVTGTVTDADLKGRTPSCALTTVYGAGAAHAVRDTLRAFAVTEQVAAPPAPDDGSGGGDVPLPDDGTGGGAGADSDGDGVPDDFDGDGFPDDLGIGGGPGELPGDGSPEDGGAGAQLSVKVYGIPRRLRRGRSYEARIRIRNSGDVDATKLRVRLARKAGVAMSRRVAPVSRVRAGKGVTVHVRVRLTSARALRTIRVTVTGDGVEERASFRLRRRGAR